MAERRRRSDRPTPPDSAADRDRDGPGRSARPVAAETTGVDAAGHDEAIPDPRAALRAIIESVQPQIDGGRFPAKRIVGDTVTVSGDIFADGHDVLVAVL